MSSASNAASANRTLSEEMNEHASTHSVDASDTSTSHVTSKTTIKKPKHRVNKRQLRHKRRNKPTDDSDSDENIPKSTETSSELEPVSSTTVLQDVRAAQQERRRRRGLEADDLIRGPRDFEAEQKAAEAAAQQAEQAPKFGLQPSKKQRRDKIDSLLGGAFTAQRSQDDVFNPEANPYMHQYVQRKLEEMGQATQTNTSDTSTEKAKSPYDDLYELPDHLKPHMPKPKSDEETGEGAPLYMNIGLAEVALPDEYRQKNIQETERAREAFLRDRARQRASRDQTENMSIMGSMTANYTKHKEEYSAQFEQNDLPSNSSHKNKKSMQMNNHASDDAILNRFKKTAWKNRK